MFFLTVPQGFFSKSVPSWTLFFKIRLWGRATPLSVRVDDGSTFRCPPKYLIFYNAKFNWDVIFAIRYDLIWWSDLVLDVQSWGSKTGDLPVCNLNSNHNVFQYFGTTTTTIFYVSMIQLQWHMYRTSQQMKLSQKEPFVTRDVVLCVGTHEIWCRLLPTLFPLYKHAWGLLVCVLVSMPKHFAYSRLNIAHISQHM